MDFKKYLKIGASQVEDEIENILSQFLTEVKNTNAKLIPFAKGLINSCKGGKRIRGVLVKLGYEIVRGKSESKDILKVAAAFEILHAGFLIHDDIEDKSSIRRGQPSLYQALGGDHYGISQAINLGDISLFLPIKIITQSNFSDKLKIQALVHLSHTVINTGWGQVMDVELTQADHTSEVGSDSSEVIRFINLFKTAKYTIAGPLQIGAILGDADEKIIKELGIFGENSGIAFQIQDDILDGEVDLVESAQANALEYITKAKKSIPKITKDPIRSTLLQQLADFLIERRK